MDRAEVNEDPGTDPSDAQWDEEARHETPTQRLDRNWEDLLQELRVVQTGVQLLTGFLLTLPFQPRFAGLDFFAHLIYLITVGFSVAATGLLIAPVSLHRTLFRRHARHAMVQTAHWLALSGMVLLGGAITGVVLLIFDVLVNRPAGLIAAAVTLLMLVGLWAVLPWRARIIVDRHRAELRGRT